MAPSTRNGNRRLPTWAARSRNKTTQSNNQASLLPASALAATTLTPPTPPVHPPTTHVEPPTPAVPTASPVVTTVSVASIIDSSNLFTSDSKERLNQLALNSTGYTASVDTIVSFFYQNLSCHDKLNVLAEMVQDPISSEGTMEHQFYQSW